MNKRKNTDEIISGLKNGKRFDSHDILTITRNFILTRFPEMLNHGKLDPEEVSEWCENFPETYGLGDCDIEYLSVIWRIKRMAEMDEIDHECLMYLTSLCFMSGKKAEAYMSITAEELMKTAGMEDIFRSVFEKDAVLFRSLHGKEPTVKDVLYRGFDMFEMFCSHEFINLKEMLDLIPEEGDIRKPFGRRDDMEANRFYAIAWSWYLMVVAPINILINMKKGERS